jgi:hypothetical protein
MSSWQPPMDLAIKGNVSQIRPHPLLGEGLKKERVRAKGQAHPNAF